MGLVQQGLVLMVHVQQGVAVVLVVAVAIMYQTYVLMVHVGHH
jgi:hypothetical protein